MSDEIFRGLEIEKLLATRGAAEDHIREIMFLKDLVSIHVTLQGAVEAQVREMMDNAHEDESGLLVSAKTIIFPVSIKHGKRLKQPFDRLYPEYQGRLASQVTLQESMAGKIIRDFMDYSFPRILVILSS